MKKFLMVVSLLVGVAFAAQAQTDVITRPVSRYSPPIAVQLSTHAYTNVMPGSTQLRFMSALLLDNPSTNSAIMYGHIGDCNSTSVSTSTILGPIEIAPSSNGGFVGIGEDACLWLMSRGSTPEKVMVQGIRQK